MGAFAEPSPFGEIAMGAATVGVFGYEGYQYYMGSKTYVTPSGTGVLKAVVDGTNHVSVFATTPMGMQSWIVSRPNAEKSPHIYTTILKNISIKYKKGEQP